MHALQRSGSTRPRLRSLRRCGSPPLSAAFPPASMSQRCCRDSGWDVGRLTPSLDAGGAPDQLPLRATARPGQSAPGRDASRRISAGGAAWTGAGTTRSAVRTSRRAGLSRHQRSQSAIRLPVDMVRKVAPDGMPDNAAELPGSDRIEAFTGPRERTPGTAHAGRGTTGNLLPRVRRGTGKDARSTVCDSPRSGNGTPRLAVSRTTQVQGRSATTGT